MRIPLYQIDAFAEGSFTGNPAAVWPLDPWLPTETMQAIAAENNLSETAFFVPEGDFYRLNGPETSSVSVWARFAQPSRLVWVADQKARERAIEAVARAAPTLLAAAGRRAREKPLDWWRRAFTLTYSAELRAERPGRRASVVDADRERYVRFTEPAAAAIEREPRASWRWRRIEGKALSVLRLAKASATFAGGPDYIAWKINRHAGTEIALKPWQRRHPLLAAISLLPRLLRSGAVR